MENLLRWFWEKLKRRDYLGELAEELVDFFVVVDDAEFGEFFSGQPAAEEGLYFEYFIEELEFLGLFLFLHLFGKNLDVVGV